MAQGVTARGTVPGTDLPKPSSAFRLQQPVPENPVLLYWTLQVPDPSKRRLQPLSSYVMPR